MTAHLLGVTVTIDRRTFLHSSAAIVGGAVIGRDLQPPGETPDRGVGAQLISATLPFGLATAGSTLAAGTRSAQTTLLVATASGHRLWVHDDAFAGPFQVTCGGEVIDVVHVAGDISPQEFTVIRAVNEVVSSHPARTAVQLTVVETL